MKRVQLLLATIALPLDYLMLLAAGLVAYQIRFVPLVQDIRPVLFSISFGSYLRTLSLVAMVWVLLFAALGLYSLRSQLKLSLEIGRLFVACTAGFALIVLLFFFNPQLFGSRFIVLVGWLAAFVFTSLGRLLLRRLRIALYRRGYAASRVLLIGNDATSNLLASLFLNQPQLGYRLVARVGPNELHLLSEHKGRIDEVVVGNPAMSHEGNLTVLEFCHANHLGFKYTADMFEAQSHNVVSHTLGGVPVIEIRRTPLDGWGRIVKRVFDLVLASVLLVLLSPLLLVIGLAVVLDSGWPPLVALERVGEAGGQFKLFKFRSMIPNAHRQKGQLMQFNERPDGPLFKMANDPRVTRFGRFIRRTSLDELPQLCNVLLGQMSLVGPRPHEPEEVAKYQNPQRKLLNIKPGLTGLAQVSGRSNLSFTDEAKLDTFYVENWSLGQDVVLLVKTVVVVLQRRAAV